MDLHDGLIPLVDDGLGNSAYLLELGDGRALAVDPSSPPAARGGWPGCATGYTPTSPAP